MKQKLTIFELSNIPVGRNIVAANVKYLPLYLGCNVRIQCHKISYIGQKARGLSSEIAPDQ
jgi:hypothetical protein